jgi:TrmH RNA methyltransferase
MRRLFLSRERSVEWGPVLRELARQRRMYRVVDLQELEDLSQSTHHEGVVLDADPPPRPDLDACLRDRAVGQSLLLDDVRNPHNLGAICRSAAHFGALGLWARSGPAILQGAAARVAEGGAEAVPYRAVGQASEVATVAERRGYAVWGLSGRDGTPLSSQPLPDRVLWVVGNERTGLDPRTASVCHRLLAIPGTGWVESLNASVAAAVAMGWFALRT